jgi:hypothetical protein
MAVVLTSCAVPVLRAGDASQATPTHPSLRPVGGVFVQSSADQCGLATSFEFWTTY